MQEFTTRVSNLKRGTAFIKYLKKVRGILASEPFHLSTLDICDHLFHTFLRVGHDLWSLVIRGFEEASEALKWAKSGQWLAIPLKCGLCSLPSILHGYLEPLPICPPPEHTYMSGWMPLRADHGTHVLQRVQSRWRRWPLSRITTMYQMCWCKKLSLRFVRIVNQPWNPYAGPTIDGAALGKETR